MSDQRRSSVRHRIGAVCAAAGLLLGLAATPSAVAADEVPDVGIWYSTWYSKLPTVNPIWATGFGGSSAAQFIGDVNADGLADAVAFSANGEWRVARSTGSAFDSPSLWIAGHGTGSTNQFLADLNGDDRSDAIVFFNTDVNGDGWAGDWYAALSDGTKFAQWTLWKSGAATNATHRSVADVTGDGRADVVSFFAADSGGKWAVAPSSGSGFGALAVWRTGFGGNTTRQFVADATGDGRADALYLCDWDGSWYVTPSTGGAFGPAALWASEHGIGSTRQFVADGNGDSYAEPYVYFSQDVNGDGKAGDLYGREYDRAERKIRSENIVLNSGFGAGAQALMQGNVTGDRYGWQASVAFFPGENGGTWRVERYRAADTVSTDTWKGFPGKPALRYRPYVQGAYQTYDSGNQAVIDEHLAALSGAEVDWLLFDETNRLNNVSGAILNRARDVATRIAAHNANPAKRDLRYAFAIGAVQWTGDPVDVEEEAAQTWAEFANHPLIGGSGNYYRVDGKPLLVVYASPGYQNAWKQYTGDKSATNHFTVRFASTGQPGEYGWQLDATGTKSHDEVMLVMPGWNNNIAGYTPVSRKRGIYYIVDNWRKVLDRPSPPEIVLINSFNEHAEETGIEVSDTSQVQAPTEKWLNTDGATDNAMYWGLTTDFIHQLKHPGDAHHALASFGSTFGAGGWAYEQWAYSGSVRTITPMSWNAAESRWAGSRTYALIGDDWQHPDVGADSARVYLAPATGSVTISGVVAKAQAGGDGIGVRILINDTQVWPAGGSQKVLSDTSSHAYLFGAAVEEGDRVAFVANALATAGYDTTRWDSTVTYG